MSVMAIGYYKPSLLLMISIYLNTTKGAQLMDTTV